MEMLREFLREVIRTQATDDILLPMTSAHSLGISWEDYCLDADVDAPRPFGKVIEPSTFKTEARLLRGLAKRGVPLDPPNGEAFMSFVNEQRNRASFENHRRAYLRLLGYYGIKAPLPMRNGWRTAKAVAKAQRDGTMKKHTKFLRDGPLDVLRLLEATPFKDDRLNKAFHHAIVLACVTGSRSTEAIDLLVANVRAERMAIEGYWQEKDDEPRTVFVPERWVWNGPGPSITWYLKHVRPSFNPSETEPHYFLPNDGTPWASAEGYRITMQRAMKKVLGYSIGAHACRFCATMRTLYGWSLEEVAEHLHDLPSTVHKHYIDHNFVRYVRAQGFRPPKGDRVPLPPLWKLPEKLGLSKLP